MFPLRDTQPSYSRPVITVLLIVINMLVFLYELWLGPELKNVFEGDYALFPDHFRFFNVLTSMFLHGGWMHVLGNMWFLWIFGDNIEDILGHGKYLLFYLSCGVAAGLAQVVINPGSNVPMVGASGAIAGVMGAYMIKFPQSRILSLIFIVIFFTTVELPAWIYLIYWFVLNFFSGVGTLGSSQVSQGGTAFFAHVGGFVAGIVLVNVMVTRERYSRRRDLRW
ncbi:MAG TPA: rhomboid family intramembrane serine protease [Candidatus Acidoferrales bacterium]|jgi:membrane associated rhomboid family serine protease|nr:rhomboid family intramembrane serine protease [Candidatus Acidoferrales bacterium]